MINSTNSTMFSLALSLCYQVPCIVRVTLFDATLRCLSSENNSSVAKCSVDLCGAEGKITCRTFKKESQFLKVMFGLKFDHLRLNAD